MLKYQEGDFFIRQMVSGFRQKKIKSIERVAQILKDAREKKGKSLIEVAHEIRLREDYLHRLEEGYYNELPADVYVKGFLKSYAEYLGLSTDRLVRLYNKERGIQENLDQNKAQDEVSIKEIKTSFLTPRIINISIVVILVVAAVSYLIFQFSNFSKNPELLISQPANDITIQDDRVVFEGTAESEAELTINGNGVFVAPDGSFSEEIDLHRGINTISVTVRDRQGRETSLTRQILVDLPEEEAVTKESVEEKDLETQEKDEDTEENPNDLDNNEDSN